MRPFVSLVLTMAILLCSVAGAAAKSDKKKKDAAPADANAPKFNVPIPVGHKAEGVTLPYFDDQGKLQMSFKIESATRADNDHLQMMQAEIETFDTNGKREIKIQMPRASLDLNTKIITSETPVAIERQDFKIVGERMKMNTETRSGVMSGRIRMLIYNRTELSEDQKPNE